METKVLYDTPITNLTVGQLIEIISTTSIKTPSNKTPEGTNKKYVYGIKGLAELLGCSITHASRIKRTGILDKAIKQNNRTIIIDAELALNLFNTKK